MIRDKQLGVNQVKILKFPCLAADSRDVHLLVTGGVLTSMDVVREGYERYALPWALKLARAACPGQEYPPRATFQDSDPDQFQYLMSKGEEHAEKNQRVILLV